MEITYSISSFILFFDEVVELPGEVANTRDSCGRKEVVINGILKEPIEGGFVVS